MAWDPPNKSDKTKRSWKNETLNRPKEEKIVRASWIWLKRIQSCQMGYVQGIKSKAEEWVVKVKKEVKGCALFYHFNEIQEVPSLVTNTL